MSGKEQLPLSFSPTTPQSGNRSWSKLLSLTLIVLGTFFVFLGKSITPSWQSLVLEPTESPNGVCPQVDEYDPSAALHGIKIQRPTLRQSVERLSSSIQIDTTVGDRWKDPTEDPEPWKAFGSFAHWLKKGFPELHAFRSPVRREVIHEHGLLYTWPGSDPTLKPLLIMSHQDVVPVDNSTLSEWIHPPFSGHVDLENQTVWGRGAVDCKLWLLGSMSAMESLLASGWQPRRTMLLAFGFDEESSGVHGAKHIAQHLQQRYGEDSIAMVVDEGMPLYSKFDLESFGAPIAAPAVNEKGMLNVELEVRSKGGHSSMPPPHTSIGYLSKILTVMEENPFPDKIEEKSKAQIKLLQCMRDHPMVPEIVRRALYELEYAERSLDSSFVQAQSAKMPIFERLYLHFTSQSAKRGRLDLARARLLRVLNPAVLSLLKTTQAVDIIRGGVKVNALPESASAVVNHRIATYSSVADTKTRYKELLAPLAKDLGLSFTAFDEELIPRKNTTMGSLVARVGSSMIETSNSAPFEGERAGPWRLLSSVIRQTWHLDEPRHVLKGGLEVTEPTEEKYHEPIRVAPNTMFANTDTRWYQSLSKNIFRFGPSSLYPDLTGLSILHTIHTVNEHVPIDAIAKAIDFYTNLMVAVDHENLEKV